MNRKCLHIAIVIVLGLVSGGLMTFSQILVAAPTGGTVVEGSATIGVNPSDINHQVITQTTPKAIINWPSFNIGAHEITEFVQPSASAIALNRIIGGDPSVILGTLKANGQVWLINPAGILFGRTATVDVAGLLATTADIANQDFMRGQYHFLQPRDRSTSVINQGQISIKDSGIAALVAPGVENSGVIEANLGTLVLASGTEYTVDFYGDNLIHFAIGQAALSQQPQSPEGHKLKDAVSNSGQLIANGGKILLTTSDAKRVVENLINMSGIIKAETVVKRQGQIILQGGDGKGIVKVTGTIKAQGLKDGEKGGSVTITGLGNRIGLFDETEIDVSGKVGGGTVLVGGDFQGKGSLPWAEAVFMGKEAKIRADALDKGDGGTVVLWSEKCTRFYGDISARGGKEGGKGGLIETSGHWLDLGEKIGERISVLAAKGLAGTWLLDPVDIQITATPDAPAGSAFVNNGGTQTWTPSGNPSNINNAGLNNLLDLGNNVLISASGDINIEEGVGKGAGVPCTLTLQTNNNILIENNGFIDDGTNGLTLVLIAGGMVTQQFQDFPVIQVFALQLNVTGNFNIGDTTNSISNVNGNTTGSNIVLLNTFGPGTHFFNTNDLFQYLPPSSPSPIPPLPTTALISSALDPNNFASTPSYPEANPNSSVIETQPSPPSPPPPPPPPPPPAPTPEAPPATPEAMSTPEPTPAPISPPAPEAPGYGAADVPVGSNFIGGGPEGQEPIQTAEAAEGREGFAEGTWKDPEAIEQTEEVGVGCPVNVEESKQPIPRECPERPGGPVSSGTLADAEVAPDSMIAKDLRQQPIGPEGVNGIDVPMGAEGIGGSSFGQEKVETAEGAEGDEILVAKDSWSPEDIDLSPEYLENLGPDRSKPLSFWRRRLFAKLRIDSDCYWS